MNAIGHIILYLRYIIVKKEFDWPHKNIVVPQLRRSAPRYPQHLRIWPAFGRYEHNGTGIAQVEPVHWPVYPIH